LLIPIRVYPLKSAANYSDLKLMAEENLLRIDVGKRTTRGRVCPRCGGKIIPSDRAVYQSAAEPIAFPVWQCERCGYEEMSERTVAPGKGKH
jgi:ribosomal protein S27AE